MTNQVSRVNLGDTTDEGSADSDLFGVDKAATPAEGVFTGEACGAEITCMRSTASGCTEKSEAGACRS